MAGCICTAPFWVAYRDFTSTLLLAIIISAGIFVFLESWDKIKVKPADTPCKAFFYLGFIFCIAYAGIAFASDKIPIINVPFIATNQNYETKLDAIICKYKNQDFDSKDELGNRPNDIYNRLVYIKITLQKTTGVDIDINERLKFHKDRTSEEYGNQEKLIKRVKNHNQATKNMLYPDLIPPPNNIITKPELTVNYETINVLLDDIDKNIDNFNRVDKDSIDIVFELNMMAQKQCQTNRKLTKKELVFDEVEASQRKVDRYLVKNNF